MKGISVLLLVVAAAAGARAQVNECPAEQEIDWTIEQLLRHEDCNKFYKCTYGQPIEYSCYTGLYFNLETWQCDWPHNVDCEDRNIPELTTVAPSTTLAPTTTTTTTPEPTTTTTTPEPTTTTTTPKPTTTTTTTTTTTPKPTTTTTTTTTPKPTTTTTTTTTPKPTTTTTTTTTPKPTTTTTTTTTTTPKPTTTTTTTTTTQAPSSTSSTTTHAPGCEVEINPPASQAPETNPDEENELEFLPNGCPVDPHVHWLLPNEEDCNLFYYCVWGQLVLRECPPTTHFNPVLQVCDWPWDAGCTVSANKHIAARRKLLKQILS